jgi:ATP-dependent DNA ligase
MQKDWIVIYRTGELHQAEMVKQIIQQNGIEGVIMNKKDSSYIIFGDIEVLVKPENEIAALQLLKNLQFE